MATEENPLNLSELESTKSTKSAKDADNQSSESFFSSFTNTNLSYIIIGIGIVALIVVAAYYLYHKHQLEERAKAAELNNKNTELLKHNKSLQQEIEQLQIDNENYVQHIDRLAAQLEQQQRQIYSPLTPMTENSFEAPDPNAVQQKPQVIKDKEEIKKMVNSKRETVQDEVDRRKLQADSNVESSEKQTKEELKQITNIDDNNDDEDNEGSNNDEGETADDNNVQALMNIIQSQNDE